MLLVLPLVSRTFDTGAAVRIEPTGPAAGRCPQNVAASVVLLRFANSPLQLGFRVWSSAILLGDWGSMTLGTGGYQG